MTAATIQRIARECGFELAGVAPADPPEDFARYEAWAAQGMAGEMRYLTDRRADLRRDVRNLLPSAKSVICVGKLYNQRSEPAAAGHASISRYAWGKDYHGVMRASLEEMAARLSEHETFEWKACVDTAPVLERTFARLAGLGWIGKNTCLINEPRGSWFFLGELITSLELEVSAPPPERCGTCTRCIDACPTDAFVPAGEWWSIDARRCIAYFTIELRGAIPEEFRGPMGSHVFGCDICQDVCPWNSRAPVTEAFNPGLTAAAGVMASPAREGGVHEAPSLESLAELSEAEFREMFR
ncbi:MAG: tRNA epoxyqueuosine(34) reductase QueG, partial [Acidobacteriia bacterium]|nr:tRNA epoxyqueuosine(34) reductase QueG [Terriglobia bacterium]